jgi:molecular chaperone HscA
VGTDGFALGVDLGTSNTVAVLRWPDGRTRALLFDGVPLLHSAAYLDPNGMLHVGRDALRMAALDPSRLEPNPKRRVDEPTVLLGQSVVSNVDLLAAVLATVARAAVEAVRFLPPAALTYPAAWGPGRRTVLAEAARRAGWPPPTLVPEPVAAARYFADVLRRPVPVGASIAVFDFGAGTLDVAVVRNTGDGFTVLGSGGIENLGGLDVDAALVGHLGRLLAQTSPEAWQRIANPESTALLRDRGRFWDDVRGAKEMLSRSAVAPVAIPGMEQAVHLTREELDRTAGPLIQRAVQEAAAVIARCGLRPDQLAGLFLVGGSSRLPIVARLLHGQLGIAPTVLEQPELPVAEGALAEVAVAPAPQPVSVPPVSPAPVSPSPMSAPPSTQAPPVPPKHPWYRRRLTWIAAAATVLVVLVASVVVLALAGDPYPQVSFTKVSQRYTVATGAKSVSYAFTTVNGNTAYLGYAQQDGLHLVGYDLGAGHKTWRATVAPPGSSVSWKGLDALPGAVLIEVYGLSGDNAYGLIGVDSSGKQRWHHEYADDSDVLVTSAAVVVLDEKGKQLVGYDPVSGDRKWSVPDIRDQYGNTADAFYPVLGDDDLAAPVGFDGLPFGAYHDSRIVELSVDSSARVIDTSDGKVTTTKANIGDPRQATVLAYHDRLFVSGSSSGYRLLSYDLASLGGGKVVYPDSHSVKAVVPCGSDVCLLDVPNSEAKQARIYAVDPASSAVRWNRPAPSADVLIPLGAGLMAQNSNASGRYTTVFGGDGTVLLGDGGKDQTGVRVTAGSILLFSELPEPYSGNETLYGFGIGDKSTDPLGDVKNVQSANCSWSATLLVCPTDDGFGVWGFASQ